MYGCAAGRPAPPSTSSDRGPWTASTTCSVCSSETSTPSGAAARKQLGHGGGVGRVRDQEDLLVGAAVGDEVVDDAAVVVADEGVLRLAGRDLVQVRAQAAVDEGSSAGPAHRDLAEVAHVEDADRRPYGRVLGQHAGTGVLERHRPAAERGELGAEGALTLVQRRLLQFLRLRHPHRLLASGRARKFVAGLGELPGGIASLSGCLSQPCRSSASIRSIPRNTDVLVVGFDGEQVVGVPPEIDTEYAKRLGRSVTDLAVASAPRPSADHTRTLPSLGDGPRLLVDRPGRGRADAGGAPPRRRRRCPAARSSRSRPARSRWRCRSGSDGAGDAVRGRRGCAARAATGSPRSAATGRTGRPWTRSPWWSPGRPGGRRGPRQAREGRGQSGGAGPRVGEPAAEPLVPGVVRRGGPDRCSRTPRSPSRCWTRRPWPAAATAASWRSARDRPGHRDWFG